MWFLFFELDVLGGSTSIISGFSRVENRFEKRIISNDRNPVILIDIFKVRFSFELKKYLKSILINDAILISSFQQSWSSPIFKLTWVEFDLLKFEIFQFCAFRIHSLQK